MWSVLKTTKLNRGKITFLIFDDTQNSKPKTKMFAQNVQKLANLCPLAVVIVENRKTGQSETIGLGSQLKCGGTRFETRTLMTKLRVGSRSRNF